MCFAAAAGQVKGANTVRQNVFLGHDLPDPGCLRQQNLTLTTELMHFASEVAPVPLRVSVKPDCTDAPDIPLESARPIISRDSSYVHCG